MASVATFLRETATPLRVLELPVHEEASIANRRSLPRVAGRFDVRLCEDGTVMRGLDLSFGGLMCAAEVPVWPGNTLDLELSLSGEPRAIAISGRVAELVNHRGRIAMRVRFEAMSQADRKRVAGWMARTQGV